MPRPQRELDPSGGPLVEFARGLRALRDGAGTPKFAAMSRRTGRSKTALADAAGGRHLPRWETVEDFVRACDADPAAWRARWELARDASRPDGGAEIADPGPAGPLAGPALVGPAPVAGPAPVPDPTHVPAPVPRGTAAAPAPPGPSRAVRPRRLFVAGLALGLVLGAGGLAVALVGGRTPTDDRPPVIPHNLAVIQVQNKVAVGPDRLDEDRTPAYLSIAPIAYCAATGRSCKVPGTEMASGVALVAHCEVEGQRMVNFDLSEAASVGNPYRADSSRWYRAAFPDGRVGYLSEVYVDGGSRGGLGLPSCGPLAVPQAQPVR